MNHLRFDVAGIDQSVPFQSVIDGCSNVAQRDGRLDPDFIADPLNTFQRAQCAFGLIGLITQLAAFGFTSSVYGSIYPIVTTLLSLVQVVLVAAALYLMFRPPSVKNYFH